MAPDEEGVMFLLVFLCQCGLDITKLDESLFNLILKTVANRHFRQIKANE